MSDLTSTPAAANSWDPLPPYERRVLGVLIEKQKTSKSADAYPMTLNSITTACNQKSNRDPVYDFDEDLVEETLGYLQHRGLVMKMTGGRVDRWRHLLYDTWKVGKVEMAILAELLLRGPQSEGDLRGRASRMDDIKDLEELRTLLSGLTERKLVIYLTEPNRRGTIVTHGFHTAEEIEREKARHANGPIVPDHAPVSRPSSVSHSNSLEVRLNEAFEEIEKLRQTVSKLEDDVRRLKADRPG